MEASRQSVGNQFYRAEEHDGNREWEFLWRRKLQSIHLNSTELTFPIRCVCANFSSESVYYYMVQIPSWWLILSGLFFFINAIFFCVLIFSMIKLLEVAKELKPKIDRISDRVDSISEKVDGIATDVQGRVHELSQTSSKISSSADLFATIANQGVSKFAPYIATFGLILKGYQMMKEHGVHFPQKKKQVPSKALEKPKGK